MMKKARILLPPKISLIGSGSWATALAKVLVDNGNNLLWYFRNPKNIEYMKLNGRQKNYLRTCEFDSSLFRMTSDIQEAVNDADILLFVTPSMFFEDAMGKIDSETIKNKFIISGTKGFVTDKNITVAEYFHTQHNIPFEKIGVISGPCHAEEVAAESLSYMTLSSKHIETAEYFCKLFKNKNVYTIAGTDIYGVEYSAALKNIYAIASGICHSLGFGDNYLAVLATNSYHEMISFMDTTHLDENRIMSKSAYLGDLLVTMYSQFSRNRTFGAMIGKGYSVKSAIVEMEQVVEGLYACKALHNICKEYSIEMPIADTIYKILWEGGNPELCINKMNDHIQ
ncbi:MAG: NAD(P)H-dependent glycerol-3-phosphate dehydrogenase [Bacteroidales bacterium]